MLRFIASDNYIIFNKDIAKKWGIDCALMLGELASESEYWRKQGKLEDGYFYSTVKNIEENTTLSDKKQRTALALLKELGIVDFKLKGLPAKRYIKINEDALMKALQNKDCENGITSSAEMEELDTPNRKTNNNNLNSNKDLKEISYNQYSIDEIWQKLLLQLNFNLTPIFVSTFLEKLEPVLKGNDIELYINTDLVYNAVMPKVPVIVETLKKIAPYIENLRIKRNL